MQDEDVEDKDLSIHSFNLGVGCSSSNAVKWSFDGRIAILTDSYIYILRLLNSNQRRKPGGNLGLVFENSLISQIPFTNSDVGISTNKFQDRTLDTFEERQAFVLSQSTLTEREHYNEPDCYYDMHWSPVGCTVDGRSFLATLAVNGEVHVHNSDNFIGKWKPEFNVSSALKTFLEANGWFEESDIDHIKPIKEIMKRYLRRKDLCFTTCMSWCPKLFECRNCQRNPLPNNIYYTEYFSNYVLCDHSVSLLVTMNRRGDMFLLFLVYNKSKSEDNSIDVIRKMETGIPWPVSVSWYQIKDISLIAVGYTNGLVKVYAYTLSYESNSKVHCEYQADLTLWEEEDGIPVHHLNWMETKTTLTLVASKGPEIVLMKDIRCLDCVITCGSCEIGPSCHSSPITSLQCVSNKFIVTASNGATQYFDIENEVLPFCDNSILRGFRCHGIAADPSLCMFVRVSCPSRMLLLQPAFVKQMEVSFLPFLTTENIALLILNQTLPLDMAVREYFLLCSTENFVLPNVLHKYCNEPESYAIPFRELHLYLYFNQMRYMQQIGYSEKKRKAEISSNVPVVVEDGTDPIIQKIEKEITKQYFQEILEKLLQLLENGWVVKTEKGSISMLLISDWLMLFGNDSILPKKCYSYLHDEKSLEVLDKCSLRKGTVEKELKNSEISEQLIQQQYQEEEEDNSTPEITIHRGECPYCGVTVPLSTPNESKCSNGHCYQRCALTLQIFNHTEHRCCSGCKRTVQHKDISGEMTINSILLNTDVCPFCGCKFVQGDM